MWDDARLNEALLTCLVLWREDYELEENGKDYKLKENGKEYELEENGLSAFMKSDNFRRPSTTCSLTTIEAPLLLVHFNTKPLGNPTPLIRELQKEV